MDEGVGSGDAFAIPDLWKKSTLADFTNDDATHLVVEELQPLGMYSIPLLVCLKLISTCRSTG